MKIKKITMTTILAIFLSFVLISGVALGNTGQIKIGVLAEDGPEQCIKKWAPTAKYLSDRIPEKTFEIVPLDSDKILPFVERGDCDFVLADPVLYVELVVRCGIARIATLKNFHRGHEYAQHGGVVFCRADKKNIDSFNDLKGKIYAAPDPSCFGAWIAVRRELKDAKIDPYSDFKALKFVGTMDAVVYAVRNGKADAGSVETDTLERMAMEGKINIKNFRIIGAREQTKAFPFVHSTRLYPEWPFARMKHTSLKLAEQVSVALIDMPLDSPAARAARYAGWTIPLNYRNVRKCLEELRLGPYKDFGKVTLASVFRDYWYLILLALALFVVMAGALVVYSMLNRRLQMSYDNLQLEIEERKRAEEALQQERDRAQKYLDIAGVIFVILDDKGKVTLINQKGSEILGYEQEEIIGKNWFDDFLPVSIKDRVKTVFDRLMAGGTELSEYYENCILTRTGEKRAIAWHNTPLKGVKGNIVGILSSGEDITERKRAEEEKKKLEVQLNHSQKMEAIGTLAGGVAHDFNNILTAIIGNADLVLMNLDKNAPDYRYIKEIHEAGQRAASLTRQLLAFSRKELIRPKVLDLNGLTMNLEKMLRRLIGEDVELVTAYAPDLWQVKADPGQIEQIIMNLSVNARDAMPKGGKLSIETANVELDKRYFQEHGLESEAGPYVMLAVTDNGTGMDKETQARIFEPFFTTKETGRGSGLGLSTVYGIVKQNKGYIWVYSEPGKGTTFKVYFPKAEPDTRAVEEKQASRRSLAGSETILVAEDDEILRNMTKEILGRYGYTIITSRDGKEAKEISDSHHGPIHLLLTDVVMPGMSGRDLAEQVKSRFPEIKVLYMSGYTDDAIAHQGVLEEGVDFIQKPFTQEGLASKIREVLDEKQD